MNGGCLGVSLVVGVLWVCCRHMSLFTIWLIVAATIEYIHIKKYFYRCTCGGTQVYIHDIHVCIMKIRVETTDITCTCRNFIKKTFHHTFLEICGVIYKFVL